jgi:hypothetical protein
VRLRFALSRFNLWVAQRWPTCALLRVQWTLPLGLSICIANWTLRLLSPGSLKAERQDISTPGLVMTLGLVVAWCADQYLTRLRWTGAPRARLLSPLVALGAIAPILAIPINSMLVERVIVFRVVDEKARGDYRVLLEVTSDPPGSIRCALGDCPYNVIALDTQLAKRGAHLTRYSDADPAIHCPDGDDVIAPRPGERTWILDCQDFRIARTTAINNLLFLNSADPGWKEKLLLLLMKTLALALCLASPAVTISLLPRPEFWTRTGFISLSVCGVILVGLLTTDLASLFVQRDWLLGYGLAAATCCLLVAVANKRLGLVSGALLGAIAGAQAIGPALAVLVGSALGPKDPTLRSFVGAIAVPILLAWVPWSLQWRLSLPGARSE